MHPADHPRYSISVAAELAGMHPQTLRMYDAKGLVTPRRTPGGTRRYSDPDIQRLRKIGRLAQTPSPLQIRRARRQEPAGQAKALRDQ